MDLLVNYKVADILRSDASGLGHVLKREACYADHIVEAVG